VKGSRANQPFLGADHREFFAPLSKMVSIRLSPTEYRFVRNRLLLVFAIQAASDPVVAHVLWNATVTWADANSAKSAELPSVFEA